MYIDYRTVLVNFIARYGPQSYHGCHLSILSKRGSRSSHWLKHHIYHSCYSYFFPTSDDSSLKLTLQNPRADKMVHSLKRQIGVGVEMSDCTNAPSGLHADNNLELSENIESFPEGGWRAWSVVLGAWCAMVACMGLLNSIGILHAWVTNHQLRDYSQSKIGWIFSTFAFFLYFGGVQVGATFSHGEHSSELHTRPACIR